MGRSQLNVSTSTCSVPVHTVTSDWFCSTVGGSSGSRAVTNSKCRRHFRVTAQNQFLGIQMMMFHGETCLSLLVTDLYLCWSLVWHWEEWGERSDWRQCGGTIPGVARGLLRWPPAPGAAGTSVGSLPHSEGWWNTVNQTHILSVRKSCTKTEHRNVWKHERHLQAGNVSLWKVKRADDILPKSVNSLENAKFGNFATHIGDIKHVWKWKKKTLLLASYNAICLKGDYFTKSLKIQPISKMLHLYNCSNVERC